MEDVSSLDLYEQSLQLLNIDDTLSHIIHKTITTITKHADQTDQRLQELEDSYNSVLILLSQAIVSKDAQIASYKKSQDILSLQRRIQLNNNHAKQMGDTIRRKDLEIAKLKEPNTGLHCRCTNCLEYEKFTNASACDICKRYICHSCQDEFGHNYPDSGFHTLCENHAIEVGTISLEELVAYLLSNGWIRHQGTNKKVWVFTAPDKYEADRPIRVILPVNDTFVDTYKKIENTIELLANLDNDPQDKVRRQIKKGTHK